LFFSVVFLSLSASLGIPCYSTRLDSLSPSKQFEIIWSLWHGTLSCWSSHQKMRTLHDGTGQQQYSGGLWRLNNAQLKSPPHHYTTRLNRWDKAG